MRHGEFNDPRLVEVYDAMCPWSRDDDFFCSVVGTAPRRVLDLGCGTGRLALGLADRGHTVTGVDPAPPSLAAARAKPGAERVEWVDGTSSVLADARFHSVFDAAVMTSHVAQFLIDDAEWAETLGHLAGALVPGAVLTFDSRDPEDRMWERWNPSESRRSVVMPDGGAVDTWVEVADVVPLGDGVVVSFANHFGFSQGERLVSTAELRFRGESELRDSLAAAGFGVHETYGGWHREPVGAGDGELLVVAHRN